jgi:hypothetical protein
LPFKILEAVKWPALYTFTKTYIYVRPW